MTGKYDNEQKEKLIISSDIINSYYPGKDPVNHYALSNKFYDAIIYKKPLWANPDVYLGQIALENGIGLNVRLSDNLAEELYTAYMGIDKMKFEANCDSLLKFILEDERYFYLKIKDFFNSEELTI
ncbi:Putative sugar transferase, fragment [Paracholeplasma brassicae]|uniref:Putative sugar transferase n=1 Tax=Acholeplasma brassicae TaxID=61635 RepID=U4KSK6_9MOLU|nr:hypothetical protein [Paracholeplasma brassicae]CCV65104.1 Putative sugar transferase, fragment [Paracholeplasma brassicae]